MPSSLKLNCSEWFLHSKTFCCCIPVRAGVVIMTVLGMLLSGFLTIALWFEVSVATPEYFDATEKGLFVAAALMQTLLFLVSIIGFIGVVVKKLLFIRIYAYGQYVNFVLNVGFACYLFYTVSKFSKTAEYNICKAAIRDPNGEEQCNGFVNFIKYIIVGVELGVLLFTLEGSIIVTRYLNNLKKHKYQKRQSRMVPTPRSAGFNRGSQLYSSVPNQDVDQQRLLSHSPGVNMHRPYASEDYNGQGEFNPYLNQTPRQSLDPNAVERGYGGGSWTYQDVAEAEKPPLPPSDQPERPFAGSSKVAEAEEEARKAAALEANYSPPPASPRSGNTVLSSPSSHPPTYSIHDPWSSAPPQETSLR